VLNEGYPKIDYSLIVLRKEVYQGEQQRPGKPTAKEEELNPREETLKQGRG